MTASLSKLQRIEMIRRGDVGSGSWCNNYVPDNYIVPGPLRCSCRDREYEGVNIGPERERGKEPSHMTRTSIDGKIC